MSAESKQSRLTYSQRTKLTNAIEQIAPLLSLSGTWTVRDVDADALNAVKLLHRHGAITSEGKVGIVTEREYKDRPDTDILNEWSWKERPKQHLRDYLDDAELFECGHRAHICNPREVDGFSCQYCIDDGEYPEYDRATLEAKGVV